MSMKKLLKNRLVKTIFGGFFALIMMVTSVALPLTQVANVYAEPVEEVVEVEEAVEAEEAAEAKETAKAEAQVTETTPSGKSCKESLEGIGWLVCPETGMISKAVDWMYNMIQQFLVINPVKAEEGQPIFEVWKYFRGITNIVFIIFLLIVIYSQITGVGITNYGIKKALPKLIVMAILVNLSFIICSLAVDVSNIFGDGLRGIFENIEVASTAALDWSSLPGGTVSMADIFEALAGGIAIGGVLLAFAPGTVFMLIPVALGALVAVASGLITIALRQALVALLIMIAPLAMVANILPNTEPLFKKWKDLLTRMLVFYPMFSLLFGASHLAGFAIIASAKDGFGIILGVAVQIFPLFFSWKLMEMSGTMLGTINSKIRTLASKPIASAGAYAESRKNLANAKQLAKRDPYTPSTKLKQFLNDRRISREQETKELNELITNRGLAYNASRNYKNGIPTKDGEEAYERVGRNLKYENIITRDKNNMNKGLGQLDAVKKHATAEQKKRLNDLDLEAMTQSDLLKAEIARGELIDYKNSKGFYGRMEKMMNVHMDEKNGYIVDSNGNKIARTDYKFHVDPSDRSAIEAELKKYNKFKKVMEGEVVDVQYAAATAAQGYDTQAKIITGKMTKYFDMLPPSADLTYRMKELSMLGRSTNGRVNAAENIDMIIAGLRVINQRGDTDIVKDIMDDIMNEKYGGLELGTHASQALANFLMFEVKDNDPFLRRFGKYINLETANMYNKNIRKKKNVTYDEYITGLHTEPDGSIMESKKDMIKLAEGTSLDNIERTALSNLDDSLKKAYGYDPSNNTGTWEVDKYLAKRRDIQTAFEPAFLSAGMKWMSGSEQINSGVKFWMGYETKKQPGTAIVNGQTIDTVENVLEPIWDKPEFAANRDEVKKHFQDNAMKFCEDQTTGQILGMRTDFREPLVEHLLEAYFGNGATTPPYVDRKKEYNDEYAKIQTRYGNLPAKEAYEKRKKDVAKLKREFAGRQFRSILEKTGKLKQIYNTRTSGTAINAKDWLRGMVGLDNEDGLRSQLTLSEIEKSKNKIYQDDTRAYYNYTLDLLKGYYGNDSIMVEEYKKIFNDKQFQDALAREEAIQRNHRAFYDGANKKLRDALLKMLK